MPQPDPDGRTTTHRLGWPSPSSDGESSSSTQPSTSTKNSIASSYSRTITLTSSTPISPHYLARRDDPVPRSLSWRHDVRLGSARCPLVHRGGRSRASAVFL